jgi:hypothetical protein
VTKSIERRRTCALVLILGLASGAAGAGGHPHKGRSGRAPATEPLVAESAKDKPWALPLPVEHQPLASGRESAGQTPSDKALHIGTVTITPGGFLSIDSARGHD